MRAYLHLPGTGHIRFALAVAVTARLAGPPLWGLLVGVPSSGKTEAINALGDVADARASEMTAPGLLGWQGSASKERPIGLLTRIGTQAFATVSDMSGLLATSDRGGRDQVFALLRDAYDGRAVRVIGSAPRALEWEGRLTLLAGATPAIDSYTSHANALGPRWVYFRLPAATTDDRRAASRAARTHGKATEDQRREVRDLMARVVADAVDAAREVELPASVEAALEDATVVACHARAAVERETYGARSITNVPEPEDSPRLAGQLAQLARGLLGLGLDPSDAADMVRRAALDSIPQARRRALEALAQGEPLTSAEVARRARVDRKVARFALEELAAVEVLEGDGDDDGDPGRRGRSWRFVGDLGDLAAAVVRDDVEVGRDVGSIHPLPPVRQGRKQHLVLLSAGAGSAA